MNHTLSTTAFELTTISDKGGNKPFTADTLWEKIQLFFQVNELNVRTLVTTKHRNSILIIVVC